MSCNKCSKEFGTDPSVKIGEKSLHVDCFVCAKCKVSFVTGGIGNPYTKDNDFYCAICYHGKCTKCGKPTIGAHLVINGNLYHKECHEVKKCDKCKNELYGTYTIIKDHPDGLNGDFHPDCAPELTAKPKTLQAQTINIPTPTVTATPSNNNSSQPTTQAADKPRFCIECGSGYSGGRFCGECGSSYEV